MKGGAQKASPFLFMFSGNEAGNMGKNAKMCITLWISSG